MFEREIQFIYDFNQNKVRKLGSFATFNQLENVNLHPAILQYISGEIDFLIYEDRQKLLKDSLFDYSGDNINKYFGLIRDEIKKSKRFSVGYIEKLILHASSFNINFLSRPNWALMRFIFEEEKEKPASEVKQILNYLYYYPFLRKVVNSYIDKKKLLKVESEVFANLLIQIDQLAFESNYTKVFNEALESMVDFFNIGVSKKSLIPIKAVEMFLTDKSLTNHLEALGQSMNDPNITKYEAQDYKRVLDSVVYEREEVIEEKQDEKVFEVEKEKEQKLEETPEQEGVPDSGEVVKEEEKVVSEPSLEENTDAENETITEEKDSEAEPVEEQLNVDDDDIITTDIDETKDTYPPKIVDLQEEEAYDPSNVEEIKELAKEEEQIDELEDEEIEQPKDKSLALETEEEEEFLVDDSESEADISSIDEAKDFYLKETSDEKVPVEDEAEDSEPVRESTEEEQFEHRLEVDEEVNDSNIFEEELEHEVEPEPEVDSDEINFGKIDEPIHDTDDQPELKDDEIIEEIPEEKDELPEDTVFGEHAESHEYEESLEPTDGFKEEDVKSIEDEEELKLFGDEKQQKEESESDLSEVEREVLNEMKSSISSDDKESMYDGTSSFDITEMLENKKMSKILDVIFDYDMEDFANAIDKITESKSEEEAFMIIDNLCESAQISTSSKEAKTFKSIVSDYFHRR